MKLAAKVGDNMLLLPILSEKRTRTQRESVDFFHCYKLDSKMWQGLFWEREIC